MVNSLNNNNLFKISKPWFVVLISVVAVSFIVSVIALIVSFADVNNKDLCFSLDKAATLLGVFVSVVGIVITSYFVVLAVNAYSHVRQINAVACKADEIENTYEDYKNKMEKNSQEFANFLYEELSDRIASVAKTNDHNSELQERNYLRLRRARLCLSLNGWDDDRFTKLVFELGELGDATDYNNLKNSRKNYDGKKLETINFVIEYMKDRDL